MNVFWKTTAVILMTVILSLAVSRQERDIATVLSVAACCIAAGAVVTYLEPVLDFLWEIQQLCNLPDGLTGTLFKTVGIALVAELSATVCTDAGNASLGKTLQILGGAVVLSLSVPMFRTLMTLIKEMIGGL